MCTDEYKRYAGCGHVVLTEHKCPAFNKRRNKAATRQECPKYKRMNAEDPYKCNKFGKEYCVKPSQQQSPIPTQEKEDTSTPSKGGLLNPKGTLMAWQKKKPSQEKNNDVEMQLDPAATEKPKNETTAKKGGLLNPTGKKMAFETSDGEDNDVEMDLDDAAKDTPKNGGKSLESKTGPSHSNRGAWGKGRGRGRGRGRRF